MLIKFAVSMDLPKHKRPGFYAQIVKGLAEKVTLWDRDKELLIVSSEDDREDIIALLTHYNVPYECFDLFMLPNNTKRTSLFDDYGFSTQANHHYLYAHLVSTFQLHAEHEDSETQQAALQIEEHLLASYFNLEEASTHYIVDQQLEDLINGIARAYQCHVDWLR